MVVRGILFIGSKMANGARENLLMNKGHSQRTGLAATHQKYLWWSRTSGENWEKRYREESIKEFKKKEHNIKTIC